VKRKICDNSALHSLEKYLRELLRHSGLFGSKNPTRQNHRYQVAQAAGDSVQSPDNERVAPRRDSLRIRFRERAPLPVLGTRCSESDRPMLGSGLAIYLYIDSLHFLERQLLAGAVVQFGYSGRCVMIRFPQQGGTLEHAQTIAS
jgi:hypothetical protein